MDKVFTVSAPGKVIVFGEHAVVHGKAAIAAAISLRSYLLVTHPQSSEKTITLDFPDIKLHHTWPTAKLPWDAFAAKRVPVDHRTTTLDTELVDAIKTHVEAVSPDIPTEHRQIHRAAASAFLYLLLSLGASSFPTCTYTLRSTIPIASGLGSSASISVCLAGALLTQTGTLPLVPPSDAAQREFLLETVNKWAFVGELNIHGNPSGIDNTVATRGRAVLFKRRPAPLGPSVTPLPTFPVLPLLLVDSKQSRSTAAEVAKVGELRTQHPAVAEHVLDAIDCITEEVHALIAGGDFDAKDPAQLRRIGTLVKLNHGLLVTLGVSHPRLEKIKSIVEEAGVGFTKLTGAGGGGCAFAVLDPSATPEALHKVENALQGEGFARYETLLGGHGIGILDVDAEPEELRHITKDAFLAATEPDKVEGLVGISADAVAQRWQFFD